MAENSRKNTDDELKEHARGSSPSFNSNKNINITKNPKALMKKKLLTEGIKKAGAAYGVPEAATEKVLETETGQEALDAAASAPSITAGAEEAVKVVLKKELYPKILVGVCGPFLLIVIFFLLVFGKDSFGGMGMGGCFGDDCNDVYDELREEIGKEISNYQYKTEIDGILILSTLIGYNDSEKLDSEYEIEKNMSYMKKQVPKLASYQVMMTKDCDDDSSTMRKIASNDDFLLDTEENRKCVVGTESTTYSTSIEEGEYDDDNSGSVYYWNLIDEEFIFEYYNDYMPNKSSNTSANEEKINEIISEIYLYYESLKDSYENAELFSKYFTCDGDYWWPIGSMETTQVGDKIYARGEPAVTSISSPYGWRESFRSFHYGMDIGGAGRINYWNIIASKSGEVIQIKDGCTDAKKANGAPVNPGCGSGYGNHVRVQHDDGNITIYAHLAKGSVIVEVGDLVEQGQVVGKMGNSGHSYGAHLHFEVRKERYSKGVQPLDYVDPNNPRPAAASCGSDDLWVEWIKKIECSSCDTNPKMFDGENYIVYRTPEGSLDVAWGIRLVDEDGRDFKRYTPPDGGRIYEGMKIPKMEVYKIFDKITQGLKEGINNAKTNNNVVLNEHQDMAMLSFAYNHGNSNKQIAAYGPNGDVDALWNSMKNVTRNGQLGLKRRRAEEFELFTTGDYKYDYLPGEKVKYYDVHEW